MHSISSLDYTIIACYLLVTIAAGLYMTKKASSSLDHYFLGGRSLPWYLLGIAGMTGWFDMTGTMIITSFLYMLGPRGLFIEFRGGAGLLLIFMLCYTGKYHRRSGCMTGAEWMKFRFGEGKDAEFVRVMIAAMSVLINIGMLAYLVRGTSLFLGMFFPYSPTVCTLMLVGLTTIYTMCAGFYGVVLADVVQGIIIMISSLIVGYIAWDMIPSAGSLAAVAGHVTGNTGWISSVPAWHTSMPHGYEMYQSMIMVAIFYLIRNLLGGPSTGAESRFFGARNDRACGLQSLQMGLMITLRWPMMIAFAVMGIYLVNSMYPDPAVISRACDVIKDAYPTISPGTWHDLTSRIAADPSHQPAVMIEGLKSVLGAGWVAKMPLVGFNGTVNPERILPAVILTALPVGLKGLILVSMFAAMMSTFTATVNGSSALFVKDIYQHLIRPRASNRELISASYLSTLGMVAAGFAMGITAKSINDLWGWIIMSLTAGGIAPALLRLHWWRLNAWGMTGGTVLGGIGAVAQRVFAPGMAEWQQFIIMTALSFTGSIGLSLLTQPTSMDRLMHFYRTTKPFGWWGPVRALLSVEERKELTREHRNDILALPFALVGQVALLLLSMQLVVKAYRSFWMTLPLFLVGAVGLYWFWWRNLPRAGESDSVERCGDGVVTEPEMVPANTGQGDG